MMAPGETLHPSFRDLEIQMSSAVSTQCKRKWSNCENGSRVVGQDCQTPHDGDKLA
jgi:hypothetical protein